MVTKDGHTIDAKDATLARHQKVHRSWVQGVEGIVCSASLIVNLRANLLCKIKRVVDTDVTTEGKSGPVVTKDGLAIDAKDARHQKVYTGPGCQIVCSASLIVNLKKGLYELTCCAKSKE